MAGDDPAGAAFGRSYNTSASKLLEAMATTRNGLCRLGDGVADLRAQLFGIAEANCQTSRGTASPYPARIQTGSISAGSDPVGCR